MWGSFFFSPISPLSSYPTARLAAQWNFSAWKSKWIILAMTIWSHVAGWQMSPRLVFWIETVKTQHLYTSFSLHRKTDPVTTVKCSGNDREPWSQTRSLTPQCMCQSLAGQWETGGCCTTWKAEFSYSGSKVSWWTFQSGEARNAIKVRQQICSVCGHKGRFV